MLAASAAIAEAATLTDHFLAYGTRRAPGGASPGGVVSLVDALESGDFEVRRVADLQVPVDKDGEGVRDPDTNLLRYKIRPVRGALGHLRRVGIPVQDQFGDHLFNTRRAEYLLVPASLDLGGPPVPPDPALHDVDHYKCYGIARTAGTAPLPRIEVETVDRFQARTLRVVRARQLCLPVDKNGEGIRNPTELLTCYRIRRALGRNHHVARRVYVSDQLGSVVRRTVAENQLCVPGTSPLLAPAPTPGNPPSPTPGPSASPSPTASATPAPTPSPTPSPASSPTPAPTGLAFTDFSGVYSGTALDFDGQDDAPSGSPRMATVRITQTGGDLTVHYSNAPGSCPDTVHVTVAPGATSFSARTPGPSFCGGTTIEASLADGLLSGRVTYEDISDPAKWSWATFADFPRIASL